MRAMVIRRPGGPEVLEACEVADPVAGPDEVVVRVRATALNRADLLQRRGRYPAPPDAPADIPGLEAAGEVVSTGSRVRALRVGDRVMALLGGGGYAEAVAVHERLCAPLPPRMTWEEAAAVPEAFLTADDALFTRGGLRPGACVLIHAAASGVGLAAAQIAAAGGARVVGLSRSEPKRRRLRTDFPFDGVFDPACPDLTGQVAALAGPAGVDIVLDLVGAAAWDANLELLGTGGRLVLVGTLGGDRVEARISTLMTKRLTVVGTVLRWRPVEERIALVREFARRTLPLLAAGRVRPVVDRVLPLERAADAHLVMERNENFGKIVLAVR